MRQSHESFWNPNGEDSVVWQEISISVPFEFVEPVSYLFSRYGTGLSMEPDGPDRIILQTYLPGNSLQRLARIDVGVRLVSSFDSLGQMRIREIREEERKKTRESRRTTWKVGERLVIKPTWIDYQVSENEVVVEIDPGIAFGTGYHPTTYNCLEALEELMPEGASILDLGTGSGILSIAAVKLGASRVVALDIDSQAVKAARQNFRRTRTTSKITLVQGSLPHAAVGPGQFDLAVANIPARAVCELAPFIASALNGNGILVASGMTLDQSPEVLKTMSDLRHTPLKEWFRDEWMTVAFGLDPENRTSG